MQNNGMVYKPIKLTGQSHIAHASRAIFECLTATPAGLNREDLIATVWDERQEFSVKEAALAVNYLIKSEPTVLTTSGKRNGDVITLLVDALPEVITYVHRTSRESVTVSGMPTRLDVLLDLINQVNSIDDLWRIKAAITDRMKAIKHMPQGKPVADWQLAIINRLGNK